MTEQKKFKWHFNWLLHFLLFVAFQIIFTLSDGSRLWTIFNLNKLGEWIVENMHWLFANFQLHNSEQLNYVTVVWILILTIHGVSSIFEKVVKKHSKAT